MRKPGAFIVLFMLPFWVRAQAPSYAELEVRTLDQSLFTLQVDETIYPYQQLVYTFKNITPGCHRLVLTRVGHYYTPARPDTLPLVITYQVCLLPDTKTMLMLDPAGKNNQQYAHGAISMVSPIRSPQYSTLYPDKIYNPNDSADYAALKVILSNTSYDRVKSDIIKESAFQYGISSNTLSELLTVLSFDKDRIMLATYCYGFCRDPQQYHIMKKSFIFSGSYQMMIEKIEYYYPGRRVF